MELDNPDLEILLEWYKYVVMNEDVPIHVRNVDLAERIAKELKESNQEWFDWEKEAFRNMQKYATINSEYFNFWLGFSSGLNIAKYLKSFIHETKEKLIKCDYCDFESKIERDFHWLGSSKKVETICDNCFQEQGCQN